MRQAGWGGPGAGKSLCPVGARWQGPAPVPPADPQDVPAGAPRHSRERERPGHRAGPGGPRPLPPPTDPRTAKPRPEPRGQYPSGRELGKGWMCPCWLPHGAGVPTPDLTLPSRGAGRRSSECTSHVLPFSWFPVHRPPTVVRPQADPWGALGHPGLTRPPLPPWLHPPRAAPAHGHPTPSCGGRSWALGR